MTTFTDVFTSLKVDFLSFLMMNYCDLLSKQYAFVGCILFVYSSFQKMMHCFFSLPKIGEFIVVQYGHGYDEQNIMKPQQPHSLTLR